MTIQYCSDLHLEFPENKKFLDQFPLRSAGEVLLLAGDIVLFAEMGKHNDFFDFLSDHFKATYWVPGNHEYYHFDLERKSGTLHEKIRSNVFLVNNYAVEHDTVRFVFSTLWSQISPHHERTIRQGMADFHLIGFNRNRFTPAHYNQLHETSKYFLEKTFQQDHPGGTIVVTHHVPTFLYYPEKFRGDALNEAFASHLDNLIEQSHANYWIYGHHHQPIPDFDIGSTKLITNQLGYVRHNEHKAFRNDAVIRMDKMSQ